MKRIFTIVTGAFTSLLFVFALVNALAAGTNLISNPSVETAASTTAPTDWSSDAWGTNTRKFTYNTTGHTGTRSLNVTISKYTKGDAKWYFKPVTAAPSTTYTYSDWYQSNAKTSVDAVITTTANKTKYIWLGDVAASSAWKQSSFSFKTPADAKAITIYHYIKAVGSLTTDDFSLTGGTAPVPTPPTVSVTAPANGATVSGSQTVSANAGDAQGVASVQFKLDGNNLGAADTTAPYSVSWDTTAVANGTHSLTAVATNTASLSTTSGAVSVTVDNKTVPTAPTVSITAPTNGATVSGAQNVTANANDAQGIANVQFKLDGNNLGTADTTAPYSTSWDTTGVANGSHTLTAVATNVASLNTTSATVNVTVNNQVAPTPPTVSITAPANGATLSNTQNVTANAGDAQGITNVQFKLDGNNLGAADTTAPYTTSWDTKTASNASHTLTAVATNIANLSTTSTAVTVTVNNPTPPTVSLSSPANGATVSGSQSVAANASDAQAVASVQFKLDGNNLGVADTTAPYSVSWDTTTTANGSHTLTAVATNTANLTATSSSVTVTVNNQVTPPPASNLIANPSFETANGSAPANWLSSSWGTNTSTFSYLNTGHTGTHSVKVQTTKYTNGAANWYYDEIPVTSGKTYKYENWYQSNVDTEVDAEITMSDGTVQYAWLGAVFANTNWTQFSTTFTVPSGAKSIAIYQILAKVGYITSDDYSLSEYVPQAFTRGLVSVSFDDGWANQYANALPLLNKYGIPGTFNILSGELTDQPDYMSAAQIMNLFSGGHEIASHTITHPDLTTLTQAQVTQEMSQSQTTLQNLIGAPVTDFAYPYGAYNPTTLAIGSQYYQSQRSVNAGYNSKDNLDLTQLKIYEVDSNISVAQVKGWIDGAIAQKTWLILVYHEVANAPVDPSDALYTTKPADIDAELAYIQSTGLTALTVHQAINEVLAQ